MNILAHIIRAYQNKLRNKLSGVVYLPARGKKQGDVLVSYLTRPFTLAPWEHMTDPHTNYWECAEIARLFFERGYDVDIINWNDVHFVPKKPYKAIVDTHQNIARLAPLLPANCKKVIHITFSLRQNDAEKERLQSLLNRRGVTIAPTRTEVISNNLAYADFLEGFGNSTVHRSYATFQKPIYHIPISVAVTFPFPEKKDLAQARTHFLFFGGGGAILKGLDLIIEAFADLPELHLHIIGPAVYEPEFEKIYAREVALPNIHRYHRPRINSRGVMTVDGVPFIDIANQCATMIYPSASEGTSGAVVQVMHTGVIPIVTPETGLADNAPVRIIKAPTVESIQRVALEIAHTDPTILKKEAFGVWNYANTHHTKETFRKAYARFIDDILEL